MTAEEAKAALSERQRTLVLNKFIAKYGEDEGTKKFYETVRKVMGAYKGLGFSKISQELFWKIWEKIPKEIQADCYFATNNKGKFQSDINHEFTLTLPKGWAKLDFYVPSKNKWIEFDGDFWHNRQEQVEKDMKRSQEIFIHYPELQCKRVKESDFRLNPDKVINECVHWINS
jgi:hypothetical protein